MTRSTKLTNHLRNRYRNASSTNHLHAYPQDLRAHQEAHTLFDELQDSKNRSQHDAAQLLLLHLSNAYLHQLSPNRYSLHNRSVTKETDLPHQGHREPHLTLHIGREEVHISLGVQPLQYSTPLRRPSGLPSLSRPTKSKRTPQWPTLVAD